MPARPAPARDQLDGRRGTDRRHAWSHRNSISGEWQCHDRERTEKSEDGDTHLKPPSSGVPSSAITTYDRRTLYSLTGVKWMIQGRKTAAKFCWTQAAAIIAE